MKTNNIIGIHLQGHNAVCYSRDYDLVAIERERHGKQEIEYISVHDWWKNSITEAAERLARGVRAWFVCQWIVRLN